MIKYLFVALALVGCGDSKQQKLETCMADAGNKFHFMRDSMAEKLGCATASKKAEPDASPFCSVYVSDLSKKRLEEEDRCVKLYK